MRIAVTLAAFFFFINFAVAEKVGCPPTLMLMQSLKDNNMIRVYRGFSDRGHVMELYQSFSGEDGRWIAVVHLPRKSGQTYSCIVDQGIKGSLQLRDKTAI